MIKSLKCPFDQAQSCGQLGIRQTAHLFSLNAITRKSANWAETQNCKAKDRKRVKHKSGNTQRKNCRTTYIQHGHMAGGKGDTTYR